MAIYGAGSKWGQEQTEMKTKFFKEEKFILGWNDESAEDIYEALSSLKVGDIIYLKSNQPGSRTIRVKGIGIVVSSFMQCILNGELSTDEINDWESLFIKVKWIKQEEFTIKILSTKGKLTNIRAASFYEEYLPHVQQEIIAKLF